MSDTEPLMDDAELADFATGHFALMQRKLVALADVKQHPLLRRVVAEMLWNQMLNDPEPALTRADVDAAELQLVALIRTLADAERARMPT